MVTTWMVAQEVTVSGRVTSKTDGIGIPGVSIVQKGTALGTITDVEGKYTLVAPKGTMLQFSFIGLKTIEVLVTSSVIDVEMEDETTGLDEVIVVGYGVQKKSVVTASIARVTSDDLARIAPTRIDNALKGVIS